MQIDIDKILPNPEQPRREFDPDALNSLADSIRQHGLINPIAVEAAGDCYILIDGERRWRAAKIAGKQTIEASIRPAMNGSGQIGRLALAMVANLQRQDMNPIEEANAYQRLRTLGYTAEEIANLVGLHSSAIHARLRLLELDAPIQDLFAARKLPLGNQVTVALLRIPDDRRVQLAQSLAQKNATIQTILAVCSRASNSAHDIATMRDNTAPSITLASRRSKNHTSAHWDALSQNGQLPPWERVTAAARGTCLDCPLHEIASAASCKECPVVDLLRRLMDISVTAGPADRYASKSVGIVESEVGQNFSEYDDTEEYQY